MPIKITVSVTGKDGKKTQMTHKVSLRDLNLNRKEARDDFYLSEAVHEHVLYNMIGLDYAKVTR